MRITSKGRYSLASLIYMAEKYNNGEQITIISISKALNISKIYLEQVFSILKKSNIITSTKGTQGGYKLAESPSKISVYDILFANEQILFEKTETSVEKNAEHIEKAMQSEVFNLIDQSIEKSLKNLFLSDLVAKAEHFKDNNNLMFYI